MNTYQNKPVLITGGAGFIGSHLVHALVEQKAQVTLFDSLPQGLPHYLSDISHAITLIQGDITSYETCLQAASGQEIIFHLAAFVSVPASIKDPTLCYQTNITGTENMLKAAVACNVSRFVFSSSSAVYGERKGFCAETTPPDPLTPYAYSKVRGELLCKNYAAQIGQGLSTVCLRYFNVYGPNQNAEGSYAAVVARFKERLLQELPIEIFGTGEQTRDFIPVTQVTQANLTFGLHPHHFTGDAFNIASGTSISILTLLKKLEQETGKTATKIIFHPSRKGDILHSHADCRKYQNLNKTA